MIRHIVIFTLAADSDEQRATDAAFIAESLESLVPIIPEIGSLSVQHDVQVTPSNADVVLIADYADHAALDVYQSHPDHVRVSTAIKKLVKGRAAVDFEM